jgi:hypothetical protein
MVPLAALPPPLQRRKRLMVDAPLSASYPDTFRNIGIIDAITQESG